MVRRAAAAARDKSITALTPKNLKVVFATHLHSDHTAGLSDLYLTPAVEGRPGALELYGPPGIADMARHIQAAYVKDVNAGVNVHVLYIGGLNVARHIRDTGRAIEFQRSGPAFHGGSEIKIRQAGGVVRMQVRGKYDF